MPQINDADPVIDNMGRLRELLGKIDADLVTYPDNTPVSLVLLSDPDYGILAELNFGETPIAMIQVHNFDDFEEVR